MIQLVTKLWARYNHINLALIDQMIVSGVNFITSILLARYLGIEEFGKYTLVWIVVAFALAIQHAAINSAMMSIGPKQREEDRPAYYGGLVLQLLIFACAVSLLVLIGFLWIDRFFPEWHVGGLGFPLAVAIFAVLLQDFFRRYFFTREQLVRAFVNDAIRYLGQITILIALFVSFQVPMDTAGVLWVIATMALAATLYGIFCVEGIKVSLPALANVTRRHWGFSKWYTASGIMQWATGNLFIVVSGALLGTVAVGALKAAQSLMGVVHIINMGLENVVLVRAAKYFHQGGKKVLSNYLKQVALFGGAVTIAISLVAAVMPEFWLSLVFGQEYRGYGFLLQWYAGIYIVVFLGFPLRNGLKAMEQAQSIFKAYVLMTCFSVAAAYPLISIFNLVGVMLGVLGIEVILLVTLFLAYIRKREAIPA